MYSKSAILGFISAAMAANFNVDVGQNNGLTFSPLTVNAQAGDTVTYRFLTQNHTATSGVPGQGCTPDGNFNSGFVPIPANGNAAQGGQGAQGAQNGKGGQGKRGKRGNNRWVDVNAGDNVFETRQNRGGNGNPPTFTYTVKDDQPVTVYCAQAQHCQAGMVMVINPSNNGATSLAAYQKISAQAGQNKLPNTPAGTGGQLKGVQQGGGAAGGQGGNGGNAKGGQGQAANGGNAQGGQGANGANGANGGQAAQGQGKQGGQRQGKQGGNAGNAAGANAQAKGGKGKRGQRQGKQA